MTSLKKNIIREIKNTKSRFISIMAIIALSVGFFSGVKAASPSMVQTAEDYFVAQNLMDIRLISTIGFDDDDINAISAADNVVSVMPGYFSDLLVNHEDTEETVRVYSIPTMADGSKPINDLVLLQGRLPQKSGECVIENAALASKNYKVGDKIVFADEVSGTATDTYIKQQEYTIVGLVQSAVYLSFQRENTNVGSGTISFYMMILPEDFATERYTNVYVRTTASQDAKNAYSDEYEQMIDENIKTFEKLGAERVEIFDKTILADAQEQLADAQKKYTDGKKEADEKISDGVQKLNNAQEEFNKGIFEAQQEIEKNEALLEQGKKELTDAQTAYQTGLDEALQQISDAQEQYDTGKQQYNQALSEYNTKIAEAEILLGEKQKEYDNAYNTFYLVTKPQAEEKLELLSTFISISNKTIDTLNSRIEKIKSDPLFSSSEDLQKQLAELQNQLGELSIKIEGYQNQYDTALQQLNDGEKQLIDAGEQLKVAQTELNTQKISGQIQLDAAKQELDSAESQLSLAKLQYETEMNKGSLQLSEAQKKIEDGEKQLVEGKAQLEEQYDSGQKSLKTARETLTTSKQEAYQQLKDAENQISDAEEKLSELKDAKWYVYSREDNIGYTSLTEDAQRVDSIAAVFPVFFLIVAILVCLTTLSRMVEERRTEIGTFKALGYSNMAITCKYFIYAGIASLCGSVVGLICGLATLPYIIVTTYGILYTLPSMTLSIPWDSVWISALVALLCTCGVALFACAKDLKLNAASLMRPKAPKPGKRILLERITPLWKHMNFSTKVTARNLFRYKARFFMTVIGVAGCTALIIAGFGLKYSISIIADRQFNEITDFDAVFALSESKTEEDSQYLLSQFKKDTSFDVVSLNYRTNVNVWSGEKSIASTMVIGSDAESFEKIYHLRKSTTKEHIPLSDDGIIITDRMSDVLKVSVGDMVNLAIGDEHYQAKVIDITENYASNYIYTTPTYYEKMCGKELKYNSVSTILTEQGQNNHDAISSEWMEKDEIITISFISDTISSVEDMLQSLNIIVLVMILCAGLLAIVVLYNLTNINIAERVREIATIKVIGFYNGEAASFIYRENIVLTVVGAFVGMFLGTLLNGFIIDAIQMDMAVFAKEMDIWCFIFGALLTFTFSALVNFIMYFKMKKISMVESLKSIE